jgi:AI-2 transport protein TqsA
MAVGPSEQRIQSTCLVVLAAAAAAVALYCFRSALVPFVLALFLSAAAAPLIDLQVKRLRVPHMVAVTTTLILSLVALLGLGVLVSLSVAQLLAHAGTYQRQTEELVVSVVRRLPVAWTSDGTDAAVDPLLKLPPEAAATLFYATGNAMKDIISRGFLVVIFLAFLLFGRKRNDALLGDMWKGARAAAHRYILAKLSVSALTGALFWLALAALNIELAPVFGLLAFLLNFIPTIGSIVAILLPIPIVLLSPDLSTTVRVLAIALPVGIEMGIGNVLDPKITGESANLQPIAILLALIFWGVLWGILGMFLAVPMTAVLRLLLERNEITAPLARLMADRPPPDWSPKASVAK